jgi:hypothetical protein
MGKSAKHVDEPLLVSSSYVPEMIGSGRSDRVRDLDLGDRDRVCGRGVDPVPHARGVLMIATYAHVDGSDIGTRVLGSS